MADHQRTRPRVAHGADHGRLGVRVESRGGFVEDQQPCPAVPDPDQRPGQRHPSPLPGRQALAVVADGFAEGKIGPGVAQGGREFRIRDAGMPQGDVVADGAGHHAGILPDPGGAGPPPRDVEAGQVGSVDQNPAGVGALETHHQAQGRGFPASRGPGEGHHTTLRHVEGQSGDGGGGGSRPGEGDLVEGQSRPLGKATAAGFVSQLDQVEGGVRGGHAVGGVVEVNPHLPHRQEGLGR